MFESWSTIQPPEGVRAWSQHPLGGSLVDQLRATAPGDCAERVERFGAWERLIGFLQAQQIQEIAGFLAAARLDPEFGDDPEQVFASVAAEVAAMGRLAPRTADNRVAEAVVFTARLPQVLDALGRGEISLASARAIADETAAVSPRLLAELQRRVLAEAAGRTTGQIRAHTRRVIAELEPDALRRRAQAKQQERHVRVDPDTDGMAYLSAYLRADDAHLIYQIIDHYARAAKTPDDTRTPDARRADTLVDLICEHPTLDATTQTLNNTAINTSGGGDMTPKPAAPAANAGAQADAETDTGAGAEPAAEPETGAEPEHEAGADAKGGAGPVADAEPAVDADAEAERGTECERGT